MKAVVEADSEWLRSFGATSRHDASAGVLTRVKRMVAKITRDASEGRTTLDANDALLAFLASRVPGAWIDIATAYQESGAAEGNVKARDALRRFLESGDRSSSRSIVWERVAILSRTLGDDLGYIQAMCDLAEESQRAEDASRAGQALNAVVADAKKTGRSLLAPDQKAVLVAKMISLMERKLSELTATDLSRLAWLHLHNNNEARAAEVVGLGLARSPVNEYCLSLVAKGIGRSPR
jgi:hypothetical protein